MIMINKIQICNLHLKSDFHDVFHVIQELIQGCVNTDPTNSDWWAAEPLPKIPEQSQKNKLISQGLGTNVLRHDAMLFDLEPNDYTIVICASPSVSVTVTP